MRGGGNPSYFGPNCGNLGIGTATPGAKLDVNGTTILRQTLSVGSNVVIGGNSSSARLAVKSLGDFNSADGIASFKDSQDRELCIGGLGLFRRDASGNADLRINFIGFNGGTSAFRDLDIYDGKGNKFATFQGSTQRLGLGTASPSTKLDVVGTTKISQTLSVGGHANITGTTHLVGAAQATATFRVGPPGNFNSVNGPSIASTTRLVLQSGGSGDSTSRKFGVEFHTTAGGANEWNAALIEGGWLSGETAWHKAFLSFYTHDTNDAAFSETMTLMGNKVGIGSTAPSTKLDVAGTSKITQTLSVGGASTFASTVYISGNLSVGGSSNLGGGGGSSQWTTSGSNIYYNSGNVGVGTTSPSEKLVVGNGDILLTGLE